MSSLTRTLQRNVIKERCRKRDGNTNKFQLEWYKFHHLKHTPAVSSVEQIEPNIKQKHPGTKRRMSFRDRFLAATKLLSRAAKKQVAFEELNKKKKHEAELQLTTTN